MALASYGGVDIFGPLVSIAHDPKPTASSISAFFGVSGSFQQWGGTRGRVFMVKGVAIASDLSGLRAIEASFASFNDGVARTLVDPYGYTWPNVIYKGDMKLQGKVGFREDGYVTQEYRAIFEGLT